MPTLSVDGDSGKNINKILKNEKKDEVIIKQE
jgi:hypothetical protein